MRSHPVRSFLVVVIITLAAVVVAGCAGDSGSLDGLEGDPTPTPGPFNPNNLDPVNSAKTLEILGISPASGPAGTVVTIAADGFDPDACTVTFGELLEASSDVPIQIAVPEDAPVGTYAIALHCEDIASNEMAFEVTAPTPEADDPPEVEVGKNDNKENGKAANPNKASLCKKHPAICKGKKMKKKHPYDPTPPKGPKPRPGDPDPAPWKKDAVIKHIVKTGPDPAVGQTDPVKKEGKKDMKKETKKKQVKKTKKISNR